MATNTANIPQEVPMFLRKTYHMIDSCDPTVACWSDDGESFIVKDPPKFETEVIPQFFKHSKFTSFVRQLNFYSFRKIKYIDSVRLLDPELEAQVSNYWRFRHEQFQRGKPELLTDMKRMTASQKAASAVEKGEVKDTGNALMKEEIETLKARLEEMNQNMTELTSMVQRVSLVETDGKKRKVMPDPVLSCVKEEPSLDMVLDETTSLQLDAALERMALPQQAASRTSSVASSSTDTDFVDELFSAFGTEEYDDEEVSNRPDPQLMDRLSEALAVLPPNMQEQIVNRLIDNIMAKPVVEEKTEMPLAAATLASLLGYYSQLVKDKEATDRQVKRNNSSAVNAIPVAPCHAY